MHFSGEGIEGCLRNITWIPRMFYSQLQRCTLYSVQCSVVYTEQCTQHYTCACRIGVNMELFKPPPAWSKLTVLHCNHWVGCIRGCIGKVTKWIIVQLEIPHTPRVNTCNNNRNTQYVHDSSTSNLL